MKIKVLDKGFVEYIDHYGSDQRIVEAARVSYNGHSKGNEKDKKLLFYLYKNRHTSPLEQCSLTFKIKLPIFVMRQLVRHRTAKLNEISARYTELKDDFYIPSNWRRQDEKNKQGSVENGEFNPYVFDPVGQIDEECSTLFRWSCEYAYKVYQNMIEAGVAREMARMILPVNIYTECYWTIDLHNLLHFIRLREDSHAQSEIQEYARAMKEITQKHFPWVMEAYEKFKWKVVESQLS